MHSTSFKDMFLKEELLRAIKDCGFEHPSEVQQECLPKALIGSDVLTQAKSGMGKTAIFVLSVLNRMDAKPDPITALIIAHTRELAYQIKNEFVRFSKYMPDIKTEVIYGGESIPEQEKMLKTNPPHILVGTPGRLLNLIRRKSLKMDKIKYFILDECDKGLEQLGNLWLFILRYERRHPEDIHGYSKRKASHDVLSNAT
jgi:ATP-dependent RNA helicase UAP56/SUB2